MIPVEGTKTRFRWLSGVSVLRLASPLHPFAQAGWTPRDVDRAVIDSLSTRGWGLRRELNQPAVYLATLLREVHPADRPSALAYGGFELMGGTPVVRSTERRRPSRPPLRSSGPADGEAGGRRLMLRSSCGLN